jgi:arsenical pump membrane protein
VNALAETWGIAGLATAGVILRPWRLPEAIWAVTGAVLLVIGGLLPPSTALHAAADGADVYLFLTGMMLLAEVARREGLFEWLAAHAARSAHGSSARLFATVYLVGTLVTIFLSNDATAVVLTPAVAAVARAAKAKRPLPYLLACAFIANAASFVLPISNPANLVIYGSDMPPLLQWLSRYSLPSAISILATWLLLWLTQRAPLRQRIAAHVPVPRLSGTGWLAGCGIVLTAMVLMAASALGCRLGLPTCLAGIATAAAVLLRGRQAPWHVIRGVSWGVLPLVAGLFVLVAALDRTGVLGLVTGSLRAGAAHSVAGTAWAAGSLTAVLCNLVNNLPAGLIARTAVQTAHAPPLVAGATLIGVDLGPNLSVTGSLATILWLTALRREGVEIGAGRFLRIGAVVMPPTLLLTLAALLLGEAP